jgi:hypothetical protein
MMFKISIRTEAIQMELPHCMMVLADGAYETQHKTAYQTTIYFYRINVQDVKGILKIRCIHYVLFLTENPPT